MPPSLLAPAAFTRAELEVIEYGLASVIEEHLDESPSALAKARDEIRRRLMLRGVLLFRYALVVLTAEGLDKEASC